MFGIRIVPPKQKAVITRMGKYNRTVGQGFFWAIPGIDSVTKISIEERFLEINLENVFTTDGAKINAGVNINYKVTEPQLAAKDIRDLQYDLLNMLVVSARVAFENSSTEDLKKDKYHIITKIQQEFQPKYKTIGVELTKIEIKNINILEEEQQQEELEEETDEESIQQKGTEDFCKPPIEEEHFDDGQSFKQSEKFIEKQYDENYCMECKSRLPNKSILGYTKCEFCGTWNNKKRKKKEYY